MMPAPAGRAGDDVRRWSAPGTSPSTPSVPGLPRLTPGDFSRFQALVLREAGIWLSDAKQALLVGRLAKRLRELGLATFGDYYERVTQDAAECVRMVDCISTNETHFFREPRQWEFLAAHVYPAWTAAAAAGLRNRRIRAWSAACSTGEEPYSLAMHLLDAFPPESGWDIELLATDISTRVLDRARAGIWPLEKSREIPPQRLKHYMMRGVGPEEGRMKAGPEIRQAIRFERLNLNESNYHVAGTFDLIFCRNVLIYFQPDTKTAVIEKLLRHLGPGGHLLLGHAESLTGSQSPVRAVGPNIYIATGRPDPRPLAGPA